MAKSSWRRRVVAPVRARIPLRGIASRFNGATDMADRLASIVRRALALTLLTLPLLTPSAAQAQWQPCAGQDDICRVNGEALVRYGVPGRYAFRVIRNRVLCDVQEFGGDPAVGVVKQCDVSYDLSQRDDPGAVSGDGWTHCASEGGLCRFNGRARVRYGAENRYVYRNAIDNVRCSVDVFGDPAFGTHKTCDYQVSASGYGNPGSGWEYCANEGGVCAFSGPGEVRYGVGNKFIVRRAVNGMPCDADAFGSDPAFGEHKHCFVRQRRR